ncbi:hypothetical protein QMK19_34090 [Streptomyces sp. H10-C2]|uniref:hypothetical protein n=1 Tax=unclassified Streptomyces TaxID=2593676 RepID=UPI0024B97097|nr:MULTISPECIES: hypothetical protein [unclassified Streptomyces]MDJ0345670.1 hypothetical protein [Streptomyces sp. PH10-H1]MDJ0374522.1 hypothetical protein [Streptomyces sp. H10-C2]
MTKEQPIKQRTNRRRGLRAAAACAVITISTLTAVLPAEAAAAPAPAAYPAQLSLAAPTGRYQVGEVAKAGQSFKIGEPAQIPFSSGSTQGTIALTVTSIEQGQAADLNSFHLGDQVKGKVPYYIHYSVRNSGSTDLSFASVGHLKGLLADGSEAQDLLTIGQFERCPNAILPRGFTNGHTQSGCAVALAPSASAEVTSAEYWAAPFTLGKGITWK